MAATAVATRVGPAADGPASPAFHDVPSLVATLGSKLRPENVLNCYVLGSTSINGAATAASDLDVVLVVTDDAPALSKWRNQQWLRTHGWIGNQSRPHAFEGFQRDYAGCDAYDVWVYTLSSFRQLLAEGAPFAMECASLEGPNAVWKLSVPLDPVQCAPEQVIRGVCVASLLHLYRAGLEFACKPDPAGRGGKKLQCSALKIEPWNLYKSKKTLFFSLRLLEYGAQLLEHGKIVDRTSIVAAKRALLAVEGGEWEDHMAVYQGLHAAGLRRLEEAAAAHAPGIEGPLDLLCTEDGCYNPPPKQVTCHCEYCAAR
eukprot:m.82095 g.82095  ORF g.82095 m.82095 type:complete len:315 (-) comp11062_c0_seq1:71-1015(-)